MGNKEARRRLRNSGSFVDRKAPRPDPDEELRSQRVQVIKQYARHIGRETQFCPTVNERAKPKIIFDSERDAGRARDAFVRIGSEWTDVYKCDYDSTPHWHLGRP